ncbi:transposase [Bradyrhizobium liaoningense]|nr:transposase [Bradyrhizobium liaoningense]
MTSASGRKRRSNPICFSPYLYRARNRVERFFNRIKQCCRVATRYDRLAANYLAFVQLASIRLWLRLYESTRRSSRSGPGGRDGAVDPAAATLRWSHFPDGRAARNALIWSHKNLEESMRFIAIISALLLPLGAAVAQDYPVRPITMLVPFAAGGPTDTIARLTAAGMAKSLGQQVIVENATGAGGTIGTTRAARAQPDGYTLLIHHVGISTAATLYRNLSYDTKTAFAPIGLVTNAPMTIIARPDFPANTLTELVAYAQQQGDKLTYANAGLGAASHLCGMLFMTAIQKQLTTVPYKGNGPIMNDLLGKQIDLTCDQATNTTGPINAKQVKAYAITTRERLKSLPDLPTADEAGLKGFELGVWHGIYAPKGTPPAVVQKLTMALQSALKDPTLVARFNDINTEPVPQDKATPEALGAMLASEIDRWAPIITAAGQYAD